MKRVCAWCKIELEHVEDHSKKIITHGICDECASQFIKELGTSLHVFLDQLKIPIFLVDKDGLMLTANQNARALVGKNLSQISGKAGGDVMECAYAHLEEGCGNSIHCKSCTIRNLVMDTFQTGKSSYRVPAYPDINTTVGVQKMRFEVSTELVSGAVFLRIDDVQPFKKQHSHIASQTG